MIGICSSFADDPMNYDVFMGVLEGLQAPAASALPLDHGREIEAGQ
jgi:hypothetical protein